MKQTLLKGSWWLLAVGATAQAEIRSSKEEQGYVYSPVGKRDPFRPVNVDSSRAVAALSPIQQYSSEQFQLRAILKGDGQRRAMFEDPEGRTFIVSEGEIFGREGGTISKILDYEVIITERTFNYLGEENLYERIISLPQK